MLWGKEKKEVDGEEMGDESGVRMSLGVMLVGVVRMVGGFIGLGDLV